MKINVDLIYPIGSIYMSVESITPDILFGGTWHQIKGRFLLASGANTINTTSKYGDCPAGTIDRTITTEQGGEVSHTLTNAEMPSHSHGIGYGANVVPGGAQNPSSTSYTTSNQTSSAGGGQGHNNIPPYYVVNVWRRTA